MVIVVYLPLCSLGFEKIFKDIEYLLVSCGRCIIKGDFNVDLDRNSWVAGEFVNHVASFELEQLRFDFKYWSTTMAHQSVVGVIDFSPSSCHYGPLACRGGHVPLHASFTLDVFIPVMLMSR